MAADTLDYFLPNVISADTKKRIEAGEELIVYLRNKDSSLYCDEIDKFVDGLAYWVSSSSFKVCFGDYCHNALSQRFKCLIFVAHILFIVPQSSHYYGNSHFIWDHTVFKCYLTDVTFPP